MFDSKEKEGLFTEIDELIFTEDIPVYNSLVFQTGQLFERFIESSNNDQEQCRTMEQYFEFLLIFFNPPFVYDKILKFESYLIARYSEFTLVSFSQVSVS